MMMTANSRQISSLIMAVIQEWIGIRIYIPKQGWTPYDVYTTKHVIAKRYSIKFKIKSLHYRITKCNK